MENEAPDRRKKGYMLRRAIADYGMGVMILGFGVFFLFAPKLGFNMNMDPTGRGLFSGLCLLYGGWRIYRGYKQNYFR